MRNQCTPEELMRMRGHADGRAAGSWVIDGNTPDETCARILCGLEEGDPKILDALPELRLGEWADTPTFGDILAEEGIDLGDDLDAADAIEDDLWLAYSDAWYAGVVEQAEFDCRARLEGGQ